MNHIVTKIGEILIKNKNMVLVFMASLTYYVICMLNSLKAYDVCSWIIYFGLIILYLKTDIFSKKMQKETITLAILFSFIIVFGGIAYKLMDNRELSLFRQLLTIKNLIDFFGIFNLLFIILKNVLVYLYDFILKKTTSKINKERIVFALSFAIIFISWIPYFLAFYPGTITPDSMEELTTIINNFTNISDHHPVIHTLFVALPYKIGFKFFGNVIAAVATSTIFQMTTLASIFSSLIVFLHKRKVNDYILLIIVLYYSLIPVHGYYSIVMWKDVMFAGTLLLLTMETIKIIEKEEKLQFNSVVSFIIVSIFCVFFRNNAIYMYIILAFASLIIFKKHIKIFGVAFFIVFSIYLIIKKPVFNYLNITKSSSAEYIGMPLQQVGRMAFKNVKFTEDEKELINKLMPLEVMAVSYNPRLSDGIKFNENYNGAIFDNNKLEYLKLYLKLVYEHPSVALESYAISTLGYWYPGVEYWSVTSSIIENNYGLEMHSKLPENAKKVITKLESRELPIVNIEWSIGFCFWIILIFGVISAEKNKIKGVYPFVPIFGIWLTMMIASPVFAEFRYIYGAYTCLPLLLLSPYIISNECSKKIIAKL